MPFASIRWGQTVVFRHFLCDRVAVLRKVWHVARFAAFEDVTKPLPLGVRSRSIVISAAVLSAECLVYSMPGTLVWIRAAHMYPNPPHRFDHSCSYLQ